MKLVRIVSILLAALAVSLAGCQTDGGGDVLRHHIGQRQQRRLLTPHAWRAPGP